MADITIEIQSSPAVFETVVPSAVDVSMYVAGPPGPAGATGPPGPAGATVLTYTAGVDLSGHRMVVLDADAKATGWKMKKIEIQTTTSMIRFIGKYLREREEQNWHYYETDTGATIHLRKCHMVYVIETEVDSAETDYPDIIVTG
jgi:hypothetical protein